MDSGGGKDDRSSKNGYNKVKRGEDFWGVDGQQKKGVRDEAWFAKGVERGK